MPMPNPTSGLVTVTFGNTASEARISVLDATGKIVKEEVLYNAASHQPFPWTFQLLRPGRVHRTHRGGNDVVTRKLILAH